MGKAHRATAVLAGLSIVFAGCGHAQIEAAGTKYPVSGAEAEMAKSFDAADCQRARESEDKARNGSHMETYLLIFGIETKNSAQYGAWASTRRQEACKTEQGEKEAKQQREQEQRRAQQEQEERDEGKRRAALRARIEEEVRVGRCTEKSATLFRSVLDSAPKVIGSTANGELWQPIGHRLEVATNEPVDLSVNTGLGGEIHVFAVGYARPALTVTDGQGYAVKTPSPWEDAFPTGFGLHAAGIQVRANVREQLGAKVQGKGCVLVFAMQKL